MRTGGSAGIDLSIGRLGQQVGGQIGLRGVDRRLHVLRRAVDVAVEAELQGDARLAGLTLRGHLGHVRDLSEMSLQRLRETVTPQRRG